MIRAAALLASVLTTGACAIPPGLPGLPEPQPSAQAEVATVAGPVSIQAGDYSPVTVTQTVSGGDSPDNASLADLDEAYWRGREEGAAQDCPITDYGIDCSSGKCQPPEELSPEEKYRW